MDSDREDAGADEVVIRQHLGIVIDEVATVLAEDSGSDRDGFVDSAQDAISKRNSRRSRPHGGRQLSVYCGFSFVIRCHGPTKSVREERGGVNRRQGRQGFTQVQVSRRGSLFPARSTISMRIIPIQVTMDALNRALRRLPSGFIQGGFYPRST